MLIGIAIVVVFGIITICLSIVITSQKEVAVIQRFGKFVGLRRSGLTFKTPFIDWVAYKQSLRIDEISVDVETITKDKVSVHITVAVQYIMWRIKINPLSILFMNYQILKAKLNRMYLILLGLKFQEKNWMKFMKIRKIWKKRLRANCQKR